MTKRVDALVKPDLLKWGRESIGYEIEVAAKKAGISVTTLTRWENGTSRPTIKQLLKIASIYKRPFAVFYLPIPPNRMDEPFDTLRDWRKLPDTYDRKKSPGLIMELREAIRRREILIDLADEMDEDIPKFSIPYQTPMSAQDLAHFVRNKLNVTYDDQTKLRNASEALKMWRTFIEELDVLIFQTGFFSQYPVQIEEMRGIAIYYDYLPIIIINSKDSYTARIFTIMHELGHLILRLSGISNVYDYNNANSTEVFCNEFAGEMLVPNEYLLQESSVIHHKGMLWEDTELESLSNTYHVSKEVILRRLLIMGITTENHYQEKKEQWRQEWITYKEKQSKSVGGPKYHTKFVRCHGTKFVETVFDAYDRGIIPANQLSEYLGSKMKHIPGILEHLHTWT